MGRLVVSVKGYENRLVEDVCVSYARRSVWRFPVSIREMLKESSNMAGELLLLTEANVERGPTIDASALSPLKPSTSDQATESS